MKAVHGIGLVVAALALGDAMAAASDLRPLQGVRAWDCWFDAGEAGGLRCIADRDIPVPPAGDPTDEDEAAEALLELVHDHLHRGNPARANELVREVPHLLRRGDLWTVRLSVPPLETSWQERRPERLVRSLLCRGGPACAVRFHR